MQYSVKLIKMELSRVNWQKANNELQLRIKTCRTIQLKVESTLCFHIVLMSKSVILQTKKINWKLFQKMLIFLPKNFLVTRMSNHLNPIFLLKIACIWSVCIFSTKMKILLPSLTIWGSKMKILKNILQLNLLDKTKLRLNKFLEQKRLAQIKLRSQLCIDFKASRLVRIKSSQSTTKLDLPLKLNSQLPSQCQSIIPQIISYCPTSLLLRYGILQQKEEVEFTNGQFLIHQSHR